MTAFVARIRPGVLPVLFAVGCASPPEAAPPDAGVDVVRVVDAVRADVRADAARDVPADRAPGPPLIDGRFGPSEWRAIQALSPMPPLPPSPTNRYADDPRAAALGQRFFEDLGFSSDGRVGCVTCHDPRRAFTDGRRVAVAAGTGTRNTPSLFLAPYVSFALWDGAADSLWSQPLMAMENPREHATTRLTVAHRVATAYASDYEAVFGPLPPLGEGARFPPSGMPGDARWEAMSTSDQTAVNRVVVNVGKAIEAYERTLAVRPTPFDRYVAGDFEAMSPDARDGLSFMLLFSCMECHNTPLFSDNRFHALRVPDDPEATRLGGDRGREGVIERLLASPFNMAGVFSDARDDARLREIERTDLNLGAFRTPTLRGVALTAPYGHAGALATLTDVVRHDGRGGLPESDPRALGIPDPRFRPFHATDDQVQKMVAFLQALTPDTD